MAERALQRCRSISRSLHRRYSGRTQRQQLSIELIRSYVSFRFAVNCSGNTGTHGQTHRFRDAAIQRLSDGATILMGGFTVRHPRESIAVVRRKGTNKDATPSSGNNAGVDDFGIVCCYRAAKSRK